MIRIELTPANHDGKTIATACGISVCRHTPVLALCRKLVAAGHDRSLPAEAWRGTTLALRIRSIGEAASLRVDEPRRGNKPTFMSYGEFDKKFGSRSGGEFDATGEIPGPPLPPPASTGSSSRLSFSRPQLPLQSRLELQGRK
jgi:hypothetical protein